MPRPRKTLSKRAIKLLHRLYDGHWYSAVDGKVTPVMQELLEAGLVGTIGRVKVIERCFVPKGSKPVNWMHDIPRKPKWLRNL